MSYPKELNYGAMKPASVSSRPIIQRFRADLQSYGPGDVARIEIPTSSATTHLFPSDTFLEGKLNITSDVATCFLDGNIYSCFQRMSIYHGSNLLEVQYNCGRLWHVLNDCQRGWSDRAEDSVSKVANSAITGGQVTATNPNQAYANAQVCTTSYDVNNASYGGSLCGQALANGAKTFDFCFQLPSALFGSMATKAIPLGACSASSFYIELEIASMNNMFVLSAGAPTLTLCTITDLVINTKVAQLPADVNNALMSSVQNNIILPATSWKVEQKTCVAGSASFNDKFAFQLSSVNAFLFWFQNTASQNVVASRSMTSRPGHKVQDYQLNINGDAYPTDVVRTRSRFMQELQRAFDNIGSIKGGSGILDFTLYSDAGNSETASDAGTLAMPHKRSVYGLDLNRFNNTQDTLLSGTSTIGQSINLIINKTAVNETANLYGAVMYDVIYTIQDGQMTANT
jgi:hypothetical protein